MAPGEIVGVEIKASATVRPSDFKALARLRAAVGGRFACGILLHDGERTLQTAPGLFTMPFKVLWAS